MMSHGSLRRLVLLIGGIVMLGGAEAQTTTSFAVPSGEGFLRLLDLARPELAAVKEALDRGDVPAAEKAYIGRFRARRSDLPLLTDWSRVARSPAWRPGRADAILAGNIDDGYSVYQVPPGGLDWHNCPLSCLTRFPYLGSLRHAYHQSGDRKYARFMVDHLRDYIREYPIAEFAGKRSTEGWVSHTTVAKPWYWCMIPERLMELSQTVNLLRSSPEVTDGELLELLHRMYEEDGYLRTEIKSWVDRRHNGGCAMIEALTMSASLLSDFPAAQQWLDYSAELALQYLQESFYRDGMCLELTTAYSMGVSKSVQAMAYALRDRPALAANRERVAGLISCLVGLSDPTGWLPSFGDLYATTLGSGVDVLAADWTGLEYVRPLVRKSEGPRPPFLNWPPPGAEQWCGYYTMRSAWEPEARYLAIDAGPWGTTHQHGDRLSFALTALGARFIIDPSGTRYAANTPDSFISKQCSGFLHNTITVDGVDEFLQGNGVLETKEPLHNRWEADERHTLFVGDYSFAPVKAVNWQRRVLFADRTYWLLEDVLTGGLPEAEVEQNFQFEADITIRFEGDKTVATAPGGAKLVLAPLGGGLQPRLTIGDREPHTSYWPDGKPKQVLYREDGRDQAHGRGWTGRSGDKLLPAPAVTYSGRLKLPATIGVLLVPLTAAQSLADLPQVLAERQGDKTVWTLPVKDGRITVQSDLRDCVVK